MNETERQRLILANFALGFALGVAVSCAFSGWWKPLFLVVSWGCYVAGFISGYRWYGRK